MRRLLVLSLAGALILAAGATAATAYVHWEGRYFSAFLPAKNWRVVENQNGIDITSPVGDEYVSFGYAGNAPSLPTLSQVRALAVRALGFRNVRYLKVGAPYAVGSTARQQNTELTATWRGATWHAIVTAGVDDANGVLGYHTYLVAAVAPKWEHDAATLAFVRGHIAFMHG